MFRTTGTSNYRYYFKFGVSVRHQTVVGGARVVSGRPAGRSAGRPAGRPGGARVVRDEQKKAGGPGGGSPPAKPVKEGVWGAEALPAKIRGVWGSVSPSQNRKFKEYDYL